MSEPGSSLSSGVNNFVCPFCGKRTYIKKDHIHHIRTHTGEKPYGCPHCPHRSARKDTMKLHITAKHSNLPNFYR